MTETKAGPLPEVTGYAKGREVEAGMLINAADLLPMHESQGSTTGENPNPLGHAEWVRVGLIGNTNEKDFSQYGSTLTGGMYVVLDTSGRPVGRMSANTIAEMSGSLDGAPAHMLDTLRMPAKVARTTSKRGPDGKMVETTEMVDGFVPVHVPSKAAREELGLPAPKLRSAGVLDPADPNYGAGATRPAPAVRPFGERVQGVRSRADAAADRAKRRDVYASGEPERAARRAAEEERRKADAKVQREADRIEAERVADIRREQNRRDAIRRSHDHHMELLAKPEAEIYGVNDNWSTPTRVTAEEALRHGLRKDSDASIKYRAGLYGVKTRGASRQEMTDGIVAALKAGKEPDYEIGAPKVKAPVDEAKKVEAAEKRRRSGIMKDFEEIRASQDGDGASFHLNVMMSDNAVQRLAEAFHLEGLTGQTLTAAIIEAVKAGQQPDLDAAPITTLKKSRR